MLNLSQFQPFFPILVDNDTTAIAGDEVNVERHKCSHFKVQLSPESSWTGTDTSHEGAFIWYLFFLSESTKAMVMMFLAQGHNISMQLTIEQLISVSRYRLLNLTKKLSEIMFTSTQGETWFCWFEFTN